MAELRQTSVFAKWLGGLRDRQALGLAGDAKPVGSGVSELRIDYGPGYRVYFKRQGDDVVILLVGGDKRTQDRDIQRALALARGL